MKKNLNEYQKLIFDACTRATHQSDSGISFSFEDLMCSLGDEFSEDEVQECLTQLHEKGYINKAEGYCYDFELTN